MSVRVKFCGFTDPKLVEVACELGADAIGFNFHPQSVRYLDPRLAMPVVSALNPMTAGVGLFVAQPFRQATALCYQLGLRAIQWYASPLLGESAFPFTLLPAFRIQDATDIVQIQQTLQTLAELRQSPQSILIDSYSPNAHGGTGIQAPWHLLDGIDFTVPVILAGGLTPENVAEAIRQVRPFGVDVASGVESAPGKKDPEKMKRFLDAAKSA